MRWVILSGAATQGVFRYDPNASLSLGAELEQAFSLKDSGLALYSAWHATVSITLAGRPLSQIGYLGNERTAAFQGTQAAGHALFLEMKAGQMFVNSPRSGVTGYSGLGGGLYGRMPLGATALRYEGGLGVVRYTSGSQTILSLSLVPARILYAF
jgi:hypothetical protein